MPLNRRPLVYLLDKPKQEPGGAILEHNDASSSASYKHVDMKEGKKEEIEEVEGMYRMKERKKNEIVCVSFRACSLVIALLLQSSPLSFGLSLEPL